MGFADRIPNKDIVEDNQKIVGEIKKDRERINNAETMMLDKQMEMTEYRAMKNKYKAVIKALEEQLKEATPKTADYKQYLDFGINLLQNVD